MLMGLIELALILIYVCVFLSKSCTTSQQVCASYGLGDSAAGASATPPDVRTYDRCALMPLISICLAGVHLFFVVFGMCMILLLILITAVRFYISGNVPKILLVASAHSVSPWTIGRRVFARRHRDLVPSSLRT